MKGFVSKLWKGVALFLVCVMVGVTFVPYLVFENNADARKKQSFDLRASTSQGTSAGVGSEDNPFTILEIVPYHDMAQLVWLSDQTMPKIEGSRVHEYKSYNGGSRRLSSGLSQLVTADTEVNKKFDEKTPVVLRKNYSNQDIFMTNIFAHSAREYNKSQNSFNNEDYLDILSMYGYTGSTYINNGVATDEGREKAQSLLEAFREGGSPANFDENSNGHYYSYLEKLHNNEVFKRMIIGLESDTIKEEWARRQLNNEGIADPTAAEITAKVGAFSIANNSTEYNEIRNSQQIREKILEKCNGFHVRVIVATPDEVNRSVANPASAVDTVAVFPEKVVNGVYRTYTANPNKSLIGMADLIFYLDDFTNKETGTMYDYFTKDASRGNSSAKCPDYDKSGDERNKKTSDHYIHDLTGKASLELLTRMVGGTSGTDKKVPLIINKKAFEHSGKDGNGFANTKKGFHNITKLMTLETAYDFNAPDFNAGAFLGRFSYIEGAGYNGATSPASDNAYKFRFRDDDGSIYDEWGGGNFYSGDGSVHRNGAHYTPYLNPVYTNTNGVFNGHVFLFNTDENFNQSILNRTYSNNNGVLETVDDYFASNQLPAQNSGSHTPAEIMRAITGFSGSVQPMPQSDLRVLEIQPCASFEKEEVADENERKNQLEIMYRKILPNFIGGITIDQMSSIEFNGITEDIIESYDFIYFGMRTGKLNTDSSGNTVYNDTDLNGLVYLHTGDMIPVGKGSGDAINNNIRDNRNLLLRGSLTMTNAGEITHKGDDGADRSDVYRYSGNDITNLKKNVLKDYVKSGHCVVFDKNFFETDSDGNIVMGTANADKLDNTSNVYDFVRFCATENSENNTYKYIGTNVFEADFTTSSMGIGTRLETGLTYAPYVEIKMISSEAEYAESAAFSGGGCTAGDGLKTVTNTSTELNFTFEIYTANTSGNFTAELYIDTYHDGSFKYPDDKYTDINGIYTGDVYHTDVAPAGGATTITVPLPDDFIGMVPWKLLVYEESADAEMVRLKRASATGYTAVKRASGDIETIKVLQILSSKGHRGPKGSVDLVTNDLFNKYAADDVLGPAVGYNIEIIQVTIDELLTSDEYFKDISSASELDDPTKNAFLAKDANNKNKYDMLLLGFDDGYGFNNVVDDVDKQEIVLRAIDQYINAGYAVLLSHDNLSFYNYAANPNWDPAESNRDGGYYSGYYVNYRLREKLAADRYGVYLAEEDRGDKDVPYKAGSADAAHPNGVAIENRDDFDKVTDPGSKGERPTPQYNHTQIQGISDGALDCIAKVSGATDRGWKLSTNYNGDLNFAGWPNGETTKIQQTNKGQVTLFPYVIDQEYDNTSFPVAATHCQYYQLDMERDDLVVWYTLDSSDISSYYGHNGPDPRNNYYIYNTENITYTGMGHTGGVSAKEVKLFINTMIAAYRAAQVPAYAVLRNDGAASSNSGSEKQYLYVDYDTFSSDSGSTSATIISTDLAKDPVTGENCVKIIYSVLDNNMLYNKKVYIAPTVFSHSTKGDVKRTIDTGIYTSMGETIWPDTKGSIDNYKDAELREGEAIALNIRDVRTNVYNVNNDGSIGAQVEYQNATIGSNTTQQKLIPVQHSATINSSTKKYCTYVPLKYFSEEGSEYNDIYLSLSCTVLYGQNDDRKVLYGDGNIVCISKRELFDLH